MEELKPFPFCGGKAEVIEYRNELPFSEEQNVFVVKCSICGCAPFPQSAVNLYYKQDAKKMANELKQKAAKKWNRRTAE